MLRLLVFVLLARDVMGINFFLAKRYSLAGRRCKSGEVAMDKKAGSRMACMVVCKHVSACRSFFFRQTDNTCMGCSVAYTSSSSGLPSLEGTSYYIKSALPRSSCGIDEECQYPYMMCKNSQCRCRPGYPFDTSSSGICVKNCRVVGTTYEYWPGLEIHDYDLSRRASGASRCLADCNSDSRCHGFGHIPILMTCFYNYKLAWVVPHAYETRLGANYWTRNCQ